MKKVLLLLFCLISISTLCRGQQYVRSRTLNFEVGAGLLYSFDKMISERVHPGASGYAEVRYNLKAMPLSIGLNGSVQIVSRSSGRETLNYFSNNIMIVSDYGFFHKRDVKLFAGFGFGVASFDKDASLERGDEIGCYYSSYEGSYICYMPRVTLQLFNHLRISTGYIFEDADNRNLYLRVGYSF
ncbi:MAG: hypothetical protein IKT11_06935 [Bacteroidales bacterium]|nr:hypothetical protein [Bacteroidales bacterium]